MLAVAVSHGSAAARLGLPVDDELRIRRRERVRTARPLRPSAAAPAGDRLDQRAGARAGRRGRAARNAGHRRRADGGPRAPGAHLGGAAGPRAALLAGDPRPAAAAAAGRGRRRGRGGRRRRARSSGPTTCCSAGARSPASSSRAARRSAGRCWGSGSTWPCGRRTCRRSCATRAATMGLGPEALEPTLERLLAALERWMPAAPAAVLAAVRARDALLGAADPLGGGRGHGRRNRWRRPTGRAHTQPAAWRSTRARCIWSPERGRVDWVGWARA